MSYCQRHMEELSAGECRSCHGSYCARCLVYSFGPKKPPFCVGCALRASGVRSGARPTLQPQPAPAMAASSFDDAPAMFGDTSSNHRHDPPAPGGGLPANGSVKSSWAQRRAERQAAKAARRSGAAGPSPAEASPMAGLDPVLSANDRQALGRLVESARV